MTKIQNKRVTVVGVGALGSHVVQLLRNEATLHIVDFDRVEAKNTLSQMHVKAGIGKLKTAGLQGTMQLLWGVKVSMNTNKLTADNADALLGNSDLVLDCLDNAEGRHVIQQYVRAHGVPCLHGALSAAGGNFGRVVWDEKFVIDSGVAGAPTCEDGEHLPFIAIVSAYLARAAQRFLREDVCYGFAIAPGGATMI